MNLNIIKATYGSKDVTNVVSSKIKNNSLVIQSSNSIFGDPEPGKVKVLSIDAVINNESVHFECKENEYIKIPNTKLDKLGIFYSNNVDDRINPCIVKALERIQIASNNKADIITNLWKSLGSSNPFVESLSWTKTSSHLNQVLQILNCLYLGRQTSSYKYVSFLEHDVLYPEGYFDYEEFDCDVICNMNYIGMRKSGFQKRNADHQPLSQLTMKFDFAISHFESLLPNAILSNSGLVEPNTKIENWLCKNPSIHVNHGVHFTSHNSIYSKETTDSNDYWGNISDYQSLFF